jgi:hypothetical protein
LRAPFSEQSHSFGLKGLPKSDGLAETSSGSMLKGELF